MSYKEKREIEGILRELPVSMYDNVIQSIGFNDEDRTLLSMQYRDSLGFKATREYIADELGISPSTLDRKLNKLCSRIKKYSQLI